MMGNTSDFPYENFIFGSDGYKDTHDYINKIGISPSR